MTSSLTKTTSLLRLDCCQEFDNDQVDSRNADRSLTNDAFLTQSPLSDIR